MTDKTHRKMWEINDASVLWIETIYEGDVKKMPDIFGISYKGHFYISKDQKTSFYEDMKVSELAKRQGRKNFSDPAFVDNYCDKTKESEKKLNDHMKIVSEADMSSKTNKELFELYIEFFELYSLNVAYYRCTRPNFYQLLTDSLIESLPEPKEELLSKLLNNEQVSIKLPEEIKQLSLNLYKIGRRRFEMHHTWLDAFIKAEKLFAEIGKRVGLNVLEVKNCPTSEIKSFLLGKTKPDKKEIQKRTKYFVFEYTDKGFNLSTEEKKVEKERDEEIKGQCANPGKAKGRVFILKESLGSVLAEQMKDMNKGDILVATSTSPDMMIAIEKASAIVADEGGMLSHAAIVSREFNIPCIVGTGNSTRVLKDGDVIEIDAEKGVVRKVNE